MGPEPDPNDPTPGMSIWGWMSPPELRWLMEQAAQMESVAEVGSLHGRSAFALLTACPGPVYCVDPWNDDADQSFPSFMRSCGHFPNLKAVRARSPLVPEFGVTVDMTFLDGAHSYEAVLADICAWLPKTNRLLCGHDFSEDPEPGFPGVARAVREVFGDRITVAPETAIWWINLEMSGRHVAEGLPTGPRKWTDEYGNTTTYDFRW